MRQYLDLMREIKTTGFLAPNRTGIDTVKLFGRQVRYDLSEGFPLVTTKKVNLRAIIYELLWFLKGDTNVRYLQDNKVKIWDQWADENGDLGRVYGAQWRSWPNHKGGTIDQIAQLIEGLRKNPASRRHIVTAWNPSDVDEQALPPCHCLFQFDVTDGKLSCQLYQRSCDYFLGVPFNIASYALFTMMVAQVTGLKPGDFIHTYGDVHLYVNHLEQASIQLAREPYPLPQMKINPDVKEIDDFKFEDFELVGYEHHPFLKGKVAV